MSESPGVGLPLPEAPGDARVEVRDAVATGEAALENPMERDAQAGAGWPRERIPAFLFATSVSASSYTLIVVPTLFGSRDLDTELLILGSLLALLFTSVAIVTFAARLDGWQRFVDRLIERDWEDLDTCGAYLLIAHAVAMAGSLAWELARNEAAAKAGPSSLRVGVGLVLAGLLAAYATQVVRSYGDLGILPGQIWMSMSAQALMAGAAVWAVAAAGAGFLMGEDWTLIFFRGVSALWILVAIQFLQGITMDGYRLASQGASAPEQADHRSHLDQRMRRVQAWTLGLFLIAPIVYLAEGRMLGDMLGPDETVSESQSTEKDYPIRELTPLGVTLLVGGTLVVLFCAMLFAPVVILIAFYSFLHKAIIPPLKVPNS